MNEVVIRLRETSIQPFTKHYKDGKGLHVLPAGIRSFRQGENSGKYTEGLQGRIMKSPKLVQSQKLQFSNRRILKQSIRSMKL